MNKIILADNQDVFRMGLANILSKEDDCRIIAQYCDLNRLQSALTTFRGVTVLFASTLKPDVKELLQQICRTGNRAVSILETNEPMHLYLTVHVHGLFFRNSRRTELVDCVRRVARGERAIPSMFNRHLPPGEDFGGTRVRDCLTPKELKVVALITQGFKNKTIALQLCTTEQTIKNCLRIIFDKAGVSDRLELALFTLHHRVLADAAATTAHLIMADLGNQERNQPGGKRVAA
jgi:DNA-binding NarL/FixJ family response regulator